MRLIDADALMKKYNLKDATKYGNRDAEQQNHSYSTMMLYEVADMIDDAPTIEAVPVVHGEWVKAKYDAEYECSNCHCIEYECLTKSGFKLPDFCPNCGAKMKVV